MASAAGAVTAGDATARLVLGSTLLALASGVVVGMLLGALVGFSSTGVTARSWADAVGAAMLGVALTAIWFIPLSLVVCALTATCAAVVARLASEVPGAAMPSYVATFTMGTTAIAIGAPYAVGIGMSAPGVLLVGCALLAAVTALMSWGTIRLVVRRSSP